MIYPKPYSIYLMGTLYYYVDGVVLLVRERERERESNCCCHLRAPRHCAGCHVVGFIYSVDDHSTEPKTCPETARHS